MKEIRLCRQELLSVTLGDTWSGSEWVSDTPENREAYEILRRCGVQKFGRGTHWMEERNVGETPVTTVVNISRSVRVYGPKPPAA